MRSWSNIILICLAVLLYGCSNTRYLQENQVLYTGRKKVEIQTREGEKSGQAKKYVKSITNHKVNNGVFDHRILPPVGLWAHNHLKPEKNKGFSYWLYNTLSAEPILISDVNPDMRAVKIESDLFDQGYFNSKARAVVDTSSRNPHNAKVSYLIDLAPPVHYNEIVADKPEDPVDSLISDELSKSRIKPGDQFNLDAIRDARNEIARRIQDEGYFYFSPNHLDIRVDTMEEALRANLLVGKQEGLPDRVSSVFKINNIRVRNLAIADSMVIVSDTSHYEGIEIISSGSRIKDGILVNALDFRKGDIYSYRDYQRSMTQLNNLGVFRYINLSYQQHLADSLAPLLDVSVDLVKADNILLDLETNLVSKSTGFIGPQVALGVSHLNAFNGAERLRMALTGGLEWQWGKKTENQLGSYSYQFGVASGLTLPRIVLPSRSWKSGKLLMQSTTVNADVNLLNRTSYYTMLSFTTNLQYQWSRTSNIRHSFHPLYVNSVNLLATTPEFDSVVNDNIYIRKSFEEQFIIGPRYEFTYNNTLTTKPNNFYFQAGLFTSGNVLDLVIGAGKEESDRPYLFLNNVYAHFTKFLSDFRYYRNGYHQSLVIRLFTGIGIPYGNATSLPYVEQFFSGGAYSLRGFTARYLGPGSYHEDNSGYIDQSGDIKLESNIEYRFDISKVLKGAVFVDMGNIWLVNEDPSRPGADFNLNTFHNQIAISTGFGFRLDFNFFVLRADFGLPLRYPYPVEDKYWNFGPGRRDGGTLFHLAIGYPF